MSMQTKYLQPALAALGRAKASAFWLNVPLVFLGVSLFFGLLFALKTPLLWGGDETTHFARVYQIANGRVTAEKLPYEWGDRSYGGQVPESVFNLIWHVNDDITIDSKITDYGTHRIDNAASYGAFADKKINTPKKTYFFPNTAAYSPVAYVPSVIAVRIAMLLNLSVGDSILLARVFGLLFYIGCVFFALRALRGLKLSWIIFAVSLIPMTLFQASIICGDAIANALAILLTALVAKALYRKTLSKPEFGALAASAILLPLVKPTYIFVSLLLVIVPLGRIWDNPLVRRWIVPLILVICVLCLAIWTFLTRDVSDAIRLIGTGPRWMLINIENQIEFILHAPHQFIGVLFRTVLLGDNNYVNGIFGQLGFDFIQVPATSIVTSFTAILLSIGVAEKFQVGRVRLLVAGGLLIAGVTSIFTTLYLTFSNVAEPIVEGVQGRYFLPFVMLAVLMAVLLAPKLRLHSTHKELPAIGATIIILTICSLSFAAARFFYVLLG